MRHSTLSIWRNIYLAFREIFFLCTHLVFPLLLPRPTPVIPTHWVVNDTYGWPMKLIWGQDRNHHCRDNYHCRYYCHFHCRWHCPCWENSPDQGQHWRQGVWRQQQFQDQWKEKIFVRGEEEERRSRLQKLHHYSLPVGQIMIQRRGGGGAGMQHKCK